MAARNYRGYGQFNHDVAARVCWKLTRGAIPDGIYVLHHCDNPPCVRPDHLFLGTPLDNTTDMIAKGRRINPVAILTPELAEEIRDRLKGGTWGIGRRLAVEYGVSEHAISKVKTGKNWAI